MRALLITSLLLPFTATAATTYTINFTTSSGTGPASGSFTYDPVAGFSGFAVVWNGISFNLTSSANAPSTGGSGCDSEASTPQFGFIIMSQTASGCTSPTYGWAAGSGTGPAVFQFNLNDSGADHVQQFLSSSAAGAGGSGSWSITAQAAPEPSYSFLLLAGVLALAALRSRRGRQALR